jgi:hypothetical protein
LPGPRVLWELDLSFNEELGTLLEGLWSLAGLEELHLMVCGLTALSEGVGGAGRAEEARPQPKL